MYCIEAIDFDYQRQLGFPELIPCKVIENLATLQSIMAQPWPHSDVGATYRQAGCTFGITMITVKPCVINFSPILA